MSIEQLDWAPVQVLNCFIAKTDFLIPHWNFLYYSPCQCRSSWSCVFPRRCPPASALASLCCCVTIFMLTVMESLVSKWSCNSDSYSFAGTQNKELRIQNQYLKCSTFLCVILNISSYRAITFYLHFFTF